jgi:cytochrome c556
MIIIKSESEEDNRKNVIKDVQPSVMELIRSIAKADYPFDYKASLNGISWNII